MKSSVVHAFGLFATVLVAGVAGAQTTQAVEWKVSEGGNGHWYMCVSGVQPATWFGARDFAVAQRGHLATVQSEQEDGFIRTLLPIVTSWPAGRGPWLGGYQDHSASDFSEPRGGWRWVTGEPFVWSGWSSGEPNNYCNGVAEDHLHYYDPGSIGWNDLPGVNACGGDLVSTAIVEWDADCNGDGVVDYGQILRGELEDLNSNGVPDICETSISSVLPPSVPAQGGSTITIRGNGFPANPTVLIGGVPATNVVRESLTRITATSPAVLPGMASVSVNDFTLADGIYIRPQCGSDLDQDGEVTAADIAIVLLDFGPCYVSAAPKPAEDSRPFMLREEAAPVGPNAR